MIEKEAACLLSFTSLNKLMCISCLRIRILHLSRSAPSSNEHITGKKKNCTSFTAMPIRSRFKYIMLINCVNCETNLPQFLEGTKKRVVVLNDPQFSGFEHTLLVSVPWFPLQTLNETGWQEWTIFLYTSHFYSHIAGVTSSHTDLQIKPKKLYVPYPSQNPPHLLTERPSIN